MFTMFLEHFPGAEVLAEAFHTKFVEMAGKRAYKDELNQKSARLLMWGIAHGRDFESWLPGMEFPGEQSVLGYPVQMPLWLRLCVWCVPLFKQSNRIVHLRMGKQ